MYKIAKINFKPKSECPVEVLEQILEHIYNILVVMKLNGQIIDEGIVEKNNETYIATVVTTDDDSLDIKYFNEYVLERTENFDIEVRIICDDPMATDCCKCKEHSYYILAIDPELCSSPIICGDCGKEIPLIRIPYVFDEKEHYSILNFQKIYKSVDNLWMNSLSDRFTKRQIVHHDSQLNQRGLEICKDLENKLNKPVYYLLCNPIGGWFEFNKNNKNLSNCPKCGGEFTKVTNNYANKVCNTCRLAFITYTEE